jgi:hypothetical protein
MVAIHSLLSHGQEHGSSLFRSAPIFGDSLADGGEIVGEREIVGDVAISN